MKNGLLIVLSGPSGAGKGTIYNEVLARMPQIKKSISVTTRKPRSGEIEGVHYYFRTEEEYNQMIACGEFLETAAVYNNHYGTPKAPVFKMLEEGSDVMFEIDNFGSHQIKKKYPKAVTIYIAPPSLEELERRLKGRGTESEDALQTRLGNARREMSEYASFDYVVFNEDVETATQAVMSIISAERCKMHRNADRILEILKKQ